MKNSDLQKALQQFPDDMEVLIFDHKKNLMTDLGDGSSEGMYSEFDIEVINDDLDDDDKERYEDIWGCEVKPCIIMTFDNPDIEIPD